MNIKILIENKNFRNNQNYIISKKYIKKLKFTLYVDISELKIGEGKYVLDINISNNVFYIMYGIIGLMFLGITYLGIYNESYKGILTLVLGLLVILLFTKKKRVLFLVDKVDKKNIYIYRHK